MGLLSHADPRSGSPALGDLAIPVNGVRCQPLPTLQLDVCRAEDGESNRRSSLGRLTLTFCTFDATRRPMSHIDVQPYAGSWTCNPSQAYDLGDQIRSPSLEAGLRAGQAPRTVRLARQLPTPVGKTSGSTAFS